MYTNTRVCMFVCTVLILESVYVGRALAWLYCYHYAPPYSISINIISDFLCLLLIQQFRDLCMRVLFGAFVVDLLEHNVSVSAAI